MKKLKIAYTNKQNVEKNESFSPSSRKPKLFMEKLAKEGVLFELINVDRLNNEDFHLAHDKKFVDEVLSCKRSNGFGNFCPDVAESLRYTSGSFLSAVKEALKNNCFVFSPTSGFHHSGYSYNGGFCSLNGLMVAATNLKKLGLVNKVLVLDLDAHYGDGTDNIKDVLGLDYVENITNGSGYRYAQDNWLQQIEHACINKINNCDIVFLQAGADPHENDPLGGYISTEDMAKRDAIVFKYAKLYNKPLVWNMAGGYQVEKDGSINKVLDLHFNTIKEYFKA